jgi:hypothetical protein
MCNQLTYDTCLTDALQSHFIAISGLQGLSFLPASASQKLQRLPSALVVDVQDIDAKEKMI